MKWTLKILLDNDAMQTNWDVGDALAKLAADFKSNERDFRLVLKESGKVLDINGNVAGEWKVTK